MTKPRPDGLCEVTQRLLKRASDERWQTIYERAQFRVRIVEEIKALAAGDTNLRGALHQLYPSVHWSSFVRWHVAVQKRQGEAWERQLNLRVGPQKRVVTESQQAFSRGLWRANPSISTEAAQAACRAEFGEVEGKGS